jgi:deoxyhypusine synthase|tara:strand:+ start:1228 stop:1578 length:351 start_codon:yes stop_codon:yes gene_type:complete
MFERLFNNLFRKEKVMATANYTQQQTEQMVSKYTANPTRETVNALAQELGKNTRSVIAKLSREGVYVAQPRATKSGEPIVRKAELVAQIEAHFGIEMPTLVKASKVDLQRMVEAIG